MTPGRPVHGHLTATVLFSVGFQPALLLSAQRRVFLREALFLRGHWKNHVTFQVRDDNGACDPAGTEQRSPVPWQPVPTGGLGPRACWALGVSLRPLRKGATAATIRVGLQGFLEEMSRQGTNRAKCRWRGT